MWVRVEEEPTLPRLACNVVCAMAHRVGMISHILHTYNTIQAETTGRGMPDLRRYQNAISRGPICLILHRIHWSFGLTNCEASAVPILR